MIAPQTKAELDKLISDRVEESLHLDYKDGRSFMSEGKKNPKTEIAKDVSAMANSAGGVLIYGMKEHSEPDKEHLPEKITPIDRAQFSREWLEQVINSNISPKIEGLEIHPVPLDRLNEVVCVVEIPQSTTAHQNTADGRYYRRYNFQSVWMTDYEIRDILNRARHPVIDLRFEIEMETYELKENLFGGMPHPLSLQEKKKEYRTDVTLRIVPINIGTVVAKYINYFVQLPEDITPVAERESLRKPITGMVEIYGENTYRDVVDVTLNPMGGGYPKYGPSRFDPVLPGLRGRSKKLKLVDNPTLDQRELDWRVHADNAAPRKGSVKLNEIPLIKREEE